MAPCEHCFSVIPEAFKLFVMQLAMLLADICNTLTLNLPFSCQEAESYFLNA